MNTRSLGTVCMIGSAIWAFDGVRWAMLGIKDFDAVGLTTNTVWAIGGLCGVLGILMLRATGTNPLFRLLSYLPIAGFLLLIAGNIAHLSGAVDTKSNWFAGSGWLFQMAGMIVVGILVLAARGLPGWRVMVPLLTVLSVPFGFILGYTLELSGVAQMLVGVAWIFLGYVVWNGEPVTEKQVSA